MTMGEAPDVWFVTEADLSGTSGKNVATKEMVAAFARTDAVSLHLVSATREAALADAIRENIASSRFITSRPNDSPLQRVVFQAILLYTLLGFHRRTAVDLMVTRHASTSIAPIIASRLFRVPNVLLVRGTGYKRHRFSWLLKRILTVNARLSAEIYVAYDEIEQDLNQYVPAVSDDISVFTNAVDPAKFPVRDKKEMRDAVGIDDEGFYCGFVGSLKDWHCCHELLRAVAELDDQCDVNLMFVGDGPERDNLEQVVDDLDMADRVWFVGHVTHEDVHRYMAACDVLYGVVRGGNPIKCYEYLATGRPIITISFPEFEFVSRENVGVTVDEPTVAEITQAIETVYTMDESKRTAMGQRGREYVLDNHTWDALAEKIVASYVE